MALFSLSVFTFSFSLTIFLLLNSTTPQTQPPTKPCNDDPYKQLNLILYPNGTIIRPNNFKTLPSLDPTLPTLSKDLIINKSKPTWARIYLPRKALDHTSIKLPLVIFFHGGGFIFLSAASTIFHDFCFKMAKKLVAVVVSVEYRLAPEHRLPAAYEDAVEALHWIKTNQSDEWLKNHVDYSNVFLMGSSAGGNIAYNAGLRVAMVEDEVSKMIKGLILIQPFFSGIHRTRSEIKLANDSHLLLCNNDMLWELSLPIGVDRDHEYCNPTVRDNVLRLKRIRELEWWVLVTDCDGDPLVDRSIGLVRLMEKNGVNVVRDFTEGGYHGVQDSEPLKAIELFGVIKKFISSLPNHTIE
ncbi:unnamed protein product [Lathyrus oleraceus]